MKTYKEIVILSGKGGAGKTSFAAAISCLLKDKIIVDADVDAADMFLILKPKILENGDFFGKGKAKIDISLCSQCGLCYENCYYNAIKKIDDHFEIDTISCEGCKLCFYLCPTKAISYEKANSGKWFLSQTRAGLMYHAKLGIAEENSGLLVSFLRKKAQEKAYQEKLPFIIIDGPPGIGCPVIASMTSTDFVLIITEPTKSGFHDMVRVYNLSKSFKIKVMLCINKYDLNLEISKEIQEFAEKEKLIFLGNIPYDTNLVKAMIEEKTICEFKKDSPASKAILEIVSKMKNIIKTLN